MLLSESYKKRVQELAGLLQEKDHRRTIVNKLKLPQHIADWAHELSDKYSIWLANNFRDKALEDFPESLRPKVLDSLKSGRSSSAFDNVFARIKNRMSTEFQYITDWLNGRTQIAPESDTLNLKELTFDQAMERSRRWHDEVARLSRGENLQIDDDGEVIMSFPDGFYWLNLGTDSCSAEGRAMGHCGQGEGTLYSLRKDGRPHVTADILSNGVVRQLRGRANTKPQRRFHPYIMELIKSDIVNYFNYWSYFPERNFWLHDLKQSDIEELARTKPDLFKNQHVARMNLDNDTLERFRNLGII